MRSLLAIATAISFNGVCFVATAAPIKCTAASIDVEKSICASPKLLAQDREISIRLDRLKNLCPASQSLLVEGQKFWLRDRWNCRNRPGALDKPGGMDACLADRMGERLQQLNETGARCDFTSLAATYRMVDVDYLLRFSDRYIDKTLAVFGWMDPASCDTPPASLTSAHVVGKNSKRDRFRVKFSSISAGQHEFLCAKNPASHWEGTVKHDSQGNYLFLTDFLGQDLP